MWRRGWYKTLKRRVEDEWYKTLKKRREEDDDDETAVSTIPFLPENVIEKILSFLPVRDVALATAVSKQWSSLWPSFSVIDIEQKHFMEPRCFLDFLRYSLRRCRNQRHLDKLRILANLEYGDVLVSEWVGFAIERCVKELDLHDLDEKNKLHKNFLISHEVLTLKCLTSLNLENVRLYASSGINGPVSLPLLKNMSLKDVRFLDDEYTDVFAIPSLISGCPCIKHLSIHRCMLGYSTFHLDISSHSLKSLEIVHCHSMSVEVKAKNLESFTFYSDCTCPYHRTMYLLECDSLKHVHISCKGLKKLLLHDCQQSIENSFDTPHLESFEFGGYLKAKVNFAEAPVNLVTCTIRVWETLWPIEYYSAMRDFLGSFDCSKKVKIHIEEAEGVIIPEHCRTEWSPPLPSINQLQLYFPSLGEREYCLRPSLIWMAPSAEILPFLIHEDDDEYDNFGDNDYNVVDDDDDDDIDDDNENVGDDI